MTMAVAVLIASGEHVRKVWSLRKTWPTSLSTEAVSDTFFEVEMMALSALATVSAKANSLTLRRKPTSAIRIMEATAPSSAMFKSAVLFITSLNHSAINAHSYKGKKPQVICGRNFSHQTSTRMELKQMHDFSVRVVRRE